MHAVRRSARTRVRFAVKVIDHEGHEMYLRHGEEPGEGSIVMFPSRRRADDFAAHMRNGLGTDVQSVNVVPYPTKEP